MKGVELGAPSCSKKAASQPRGNEQRYYDALQTITRYQSPETLKRYACVYGGGLQPMEALEMAYENMQAEARAAIRGKRRPTL